MQLPARAELCGLILAAAAPGGARVALDNKAVTTLHEALRQGSLRLARAPWPLRPNGDVWA
eukprot:5680169-Lingulodinium_polyedra.AAC.1